MERKLYFFLAFFLFNSVSWGWSSFRARIGSEQVFPYQSSNPTVELKTTRNINQQQSEECYLFAFTGALEVANMNAWGRAQAPEFSTEYLFIQKLLAWSKEVLTNQSNLNDSFYFLNGGDVHHALKVSLEVGLFPQELFKPQIDFAYWNFELLYQDVKEIVKLGRKRLASASAEVLKDEIVKKTLLQVQNRIEVEAGFQPQEFIWGGKNWNAGKFQKAFGVKKGSHVYMMYAQDKWDMGDPWDLKNAVSEMIKVFKGAFNYKQSSWNQIWQYLVGSVDRGLPSLVSMRWAGSYHVLNVVGYEYNNRNEIVSFKLKNSWGEDYGDRGHAFFGLQDIQKYSTSVWGFRAP